MGVHNFLGKSYFCGMEQTTLNRTKLIKGGGGGRKMAPDGSELCGPFVTSQGEQRLRQLSSRSEQRLKKGYLGTQ